MYCRDVRVRHSDTEPNDAIAGSHADADANTNAEAHPDTGPYAYTVRSTRPDDGNEL